MPSTAGAPFLTTLSLFLVVSVSGQRCAAPRGSTQAAQDSEDAVIVTLDDDASHLVLDVDEVVVVKLDCSPGTGYSWQVADGEAGLLEAVGAPFFEPKTTNKGSEASVGGEEVQVLHFRGRKVGSGALELHYRREWEEGIEPARVFRVTVEVQDPPNER